MEAESRASGAGAPRRNVEIKARVRHPDRLHERARALAGTPSSVLRQTDTFFHVPTGRLKLREIEEEAARGEDAPLTRRAASGGPRRRAELIQYHRADDAGPKESSYRLAPVSDPDAMRALLEAALGVRAVVRKTRTLYIAGRTRIHVDEVEGLGDFMELEVVLREGESVEDGAREADRLRESLGVARENLVRGAYVDLLDPPKIP